jgi:O-antigen/teichoic acid export membrane protein
LNASNPENTETNRPESPKSRMRRYVQTLASSYLALAAAAVYTAISVPLALHFLSRSEFGLWALMVQIGGYLALIDMGMSSSVARFLIDHKDYPEQGEYGSVLQTGQMVLLVQGSIVAVAGYLASPSLAQLLDIPSELQHSFIVLMRWQSVLLGATMATETLVHLLYSHQRYDVVNYAQPLSYILMTGVLWLALRFGTGVYSVILSNAAGLLLVRVVVIAACLKLRLFPPSGAWGRPSWARFKELFGFGKDMFLIALGSQLMSASQTIIISRTLGLEKVAIWSVGTKVFTLIWQLARRILDFSGPALAEMVTRKEHDRLRERFRALSILTTSVGGLAAVLVAVCNAPFVTVWTHGRIPWETGYDVLLGVWLVVLSVQHGHVSLVGATKDIRFMRWIYLVEGTVFVALAFLTARWTGLPGIIACSIICTVSITGAYSVWRSSRYFLLPVTEPSWEWLKPLGRTLLRLVPLAAGIWWLTEPLTDWLQVVVRGAVLTPLGSVLVLRYGVVRELQREFVQRLPKAFTPWLRIVVGNLD